jgi:hypothetical protein
VVELANGDDGLRGGKLRGWHSPNIVFLGFWCEVTIGHIADDVVAMGDGCSEVAVMGDGWSEVAAMEDGWWEGPTGNTLMTLVPWSNFYFRAPHYAIIIIRLAITQKFPQI